MGPVWDKKRFIFKGKMAVASAAAVFDKSSKTITYPLLIAEPHSAYLFFLSSISYHYQPNNASLLYPSCSSASSSVASLFSCCNDKALSLKISGATPFACINCNKTYVTSNESIIFSIIGKYVEYLVFSEEYKIV
jgi:hypothetical protein